MQRRKNNIIIILIIIMIGRLSQVIFSVIVDPTANKHAGIPRGNRTDNIVSTGYNQLKQDNTKEEQPSPIKDTMLTRYNSNCEYGIGKCQSFMMQYTNAGFQRLSTIQYVGKYVNPAFPNSITNQINKITETSPLWPYPYVFAQTMGPSSKKEQEDITGARITRNNAITVGERGIFYTCDREKLKKIKNLTIYKDFLDAVQHKDPKLRAPCKDYRLSHNLAFNYFQYKGDRNKASYYYMVASFHDDIPGITSAMPAIVYGRGGDNLISANIRYDRFQNTIEQRKKIKDKESDEAKEIEKAIDNAIKKAVSEISIYILDQTYPHVGKNGQEIYPSQVITTIDKLLSQCDTHKTVCELISYGLKQGWIKKNGILIYPLDNTMIYGWRKDRNIWWVIKKQI